MTQEQMPRKAAPLNEYLIEVATPLADKALAAIGRLPEEMRAERERELFLGYASDMLCKTTQWMLDKKLTEHFRSSSAAAVPMRQKSLLLIECSEAFKNQLEKAFAKSIERTTLLGPAAPKPYGL